MKRIPVLLFIFCCAFVHAQDRPFWNEIKAFKKSDSLKSPPKKAIVFVGSSSFRYWTDLQQDFPNHRVINRGFGGSGLPNVIAYADLIITPYKPKQVVIYCGENDYYQEKDVTPELVASRFSELFRLIRKELPNVYITFVALKPSPRRKEIMPEMVKTNALVKEFMGREKRATFVNVYDPMLDAAGRPRKELFKSDSLHMNENGYDLWQKTIRPYLHKTKKP